ncbi:MAG: amidohydrolase [Alphaproteobacteria bacterium]|nr:amidohydrolase [Alphaproteobacteria bacterium]
MTATEPSRPRLAAPAGATDTHMHIYEGRFPLAPTATFKPPEAPVTAYRAVCRRLGIERCVIVQPTGYGFDNACTLAGMATFGPGARGICVVAPETTDGELLRLHGLGIRGVRFHMLPGGVLGWDALPTLAAKVAPLGWVIDLQLNGREFPSIVDRIRNLPARIVVDHIGKFLEPPVPPEHLSVRCLLDLLATGRFWVKLSAPYDVSASGPPGYDDASAIARALVRAAPERVLWASNWPHPGPPTDKPKPKPDDAALLDLLLDWAPDEPTRQRILVDNPAALFGFDG